MYVAVCLGADLDVSVSGFWTGRFYAECEQRIVFFHEFKSFLDGVYEYVFAGDE